MDGKLPRSGSTPSIIFRGRRGKSGAPERMEIVTGACRVTLDGTTTSNAYATGTWFDVPGQSGFTIEVSAGLCEYFCLFL